MAILRVLLTIQIAIIILIGFAGLSGAGPKLGPEFQISPLTTPSYDKRLPAAVYNYRHREYLVVWQNDDPISRNIYAGRVSESGEFTDLPWLTVSDGPTDRVQPAVAYNIINDEYLVVWMDNVNDDGSTYEIWGRRVAWNFTTRGPEFQIITWPTRTFWTPRVVWNSNRNEYLVVWNALDAATSVPNDIAFVILSATGARLHETIITSAGQPHQVDVTYNIASDEYLVVWRHMYAPGDGDIRGARIRGSDGAVVTDPGIFVINAEPQDQQLPAVATNQQHRYLVVWQYAQTGPCCYWAVRAQELDVNGGLLDRTRGIGISDGRKTDVAAKSGNLRDYLVVWQREWSRGTEVLASHWGDVEGAWISVADNAFWQNENPVVVAGDRSYLIVYEGDSVGDPTFDRAIYGRILWPHVLYLPLILR